MYLNIGNSVSNQLPNNNMRGFSFSRKRFIGITQVKQKVARATGIPTTKQGVERKIGAVIVKMIFGK